MKIKVRPLKEEDAYTSVKWRNIPEIWEYTKFDSSKKVTLDNELDWIRKLTQDKTCRRFSILVDEKYVGNIYLINIQEKTAEFHIFIGEKEYWGKGVAREASKQIIEFAQNDLHLEKISLKVNRCNKAALALYHGIDFKKVGEEDEFIEMELSFPMYRGLPSANNENLPVANDRGAQDPVFADLS